MKPSRNLSLVPVAALVVLFALNAQAQVASLDPTGADANFDLNQQPGVAPLRGITPTQEHSLLAFQSAYGSQVYVRWDDFAGSVDALWDFRTPPHSGTPAEAALAFIGENQLLFGVTDLSTLTLRSEVPALGGTLVRFDQHYQGLKVHGGGLGVVLNASNEVIGVFGPYYAVSGISPLPILSASDAVATARAGLAPFAVDLPAEASELLEPALAKWESLLGPVREPAPELSVFPTAENFRLAWDFYLYSRNPFGVFRLAIDAESGAVLSRENMIRTQATSNLVAATADIFPTAPGIDKTLQDTGIIPKDESGRPRGQLRVTLRNFDASNRTTGVEGELTGTHAHVHNALAGKLPFAQPPLGTWHFAADAPPVEQATRDDVHFGPEAEPAEHQEGRN